MNLRTQRHTSARALTMGRVRSATMAMSVMLASVALDAEAAASTDEAPKWQQVALQGEYRGYGDGTNPFTFDKATFDKLVQNFHTHPSYKAGADGIGLADVVAWDFSHASEYPPFMGDLPVNGAPAQGWVRELETRVDAEGKASLWALTRWLTKAKEYIKEGQYKWASVAVDLKAMDAVSGEPIGPVLTSIAMTNSPFIEGMIELAASRSAQPLGAELRVSPGRRADVAADYYYSSASTPKDALASFRSLFGLPLTAGAAEVSAQLEKLSGMAAGTIPTDDSIELDCIVGAVRQILNLGVLSTTPEVIAEAQQFIKGLAGPETASVSATTSNADTVRAGEDMDLLKVLAGKLGSKETAESVIAAVDALFEFRKVVATKLTRENANDSIVLAEIVKLAGDNADLTAKLEAIATALGVQDPAMAIQKLTEVIANSQKLIEIMPELADLKAKAADTAAQQQQMDVAAARDGHFDGNDKLDSLLVLEHKAIGRVEFLKKYPAPSADTRHLTTDVSGGGGSGRVAATRGTALQHPGANTPGRGGAGPVQGAVDVSDQPGPNVTIKTMNHIKATVAGADKWDHEMLWERAARMCDQGKAFMRPDAILS